MKNFEIVFSSAITSANWNNIYIMFANARGKKLKNAPIKLEDVLYKTVYIYSNLTRDDITFLKGLIYGYTQMPALFVRKDDQGIINLA